MFTPVFHDVVGYKLFSLAVVHVVLHDLLFAFAVDFEVLSAISIIPVSFLSRSFAQLYSQVAALITELMLLVLSEPGVASWVGLDYGDDIQSKRTP